MKQKIAILTDSSSSIYTREHNFDNIFMIDIPCFIGDDIFTNFKENKDSVFYDALSKTSLVAKTSQPSVGETVDKFELIKSLGFTNIIYIPISKELSGTYQNGFISKDMVEGIEIDIVDTLTSISILGGMTLEAAKMAKEGHTVEEIKTRIMSLRFNSGYFATVSDLTSLVKNGRLSNAKSFIANLLKIKPVIQLNDEGRLVGIENVRTFKGAIKRIVDKIAESVDPKKGEIHIGYTNNTGELEYAKGLIEERFPNIKIFVFTVPSTIVAHLGLGAIGLGYINY